MHFFLFKSRDIPTMDFSKSMTLWILCICLLGKSLTEKQGSVDGEQQQTDSSVSGRWSFFLVKVLGSAQVL